MPMDPINYFSNSSSYVEYINDQNGLETKSADASAAAEMNFETFLKLLVTELENQDPLDPLDNKEMTAQLAQFSSLEQNIQSNEYLEKLANQTGYSQQTVALSYIGKDVLIPGDLTASNGENAVSINYSLNDVATAVNIEIIDADGQVVRNMEGDLTTGRNEVVWDSKNDAGEPVEPGFYTFKVSGVRPDGSDADVEEYTFGRVHSLEGEGDDIVFTSEDGRNFGLDEIILVRESFLSQAGSGSGSSGDTSGDGSADAGGSDGSEGSGESGESEEEQEAAA